MENLGINTQKQIPPYLFFFLNIKFRSGDRKIQKIFEVVGAENVVLLTGL